MPKDALAQFAVNQARSVVAPDGDLVLDDVRGSVAYIRYRVRKSQAECAQCVVGPDDLRIFLQDFFHTRAPHITEFDIKVEEATW